VDDVLRLIVVVSCLLGMTLVSGSSAANSNVYPSVISFEGGGDSEGSRDHYFDLDYGFSTGARLLLSFGTHRTAAQDDPITTRSSLLGFRTDPMARLSAGVDLEHWGEKDTLVTDTLRLVMEMNLPQWSFSLRPQWRTLTFTTDCIALILPNCNPETEVKSTGSAVDVSYFTDGPWSFSMGFAKHHYDKKIEALAQYPVFQLIFSAATLDLATGLEDRRGRFGVSYAHGDSLWGISWLKSVSKLTGDASVVSTLRYSTDLNAQWRLRLRIGSQSLEDGSGRVGFSGVGLAYSW
jgi:hypothetical protein